MRWSYLLCGAAAVLPLAGCANLLSIDRESEVVSTNDFGNKTATAIHLDAKQRLVFSDSRALCAEPSPDALSALAASASGGLAVGQDAGSVAQALQETAGSIGLRTQSITLMRDTLYRMCEAYHNGAIRDRDFVQLLQRSQDLTLGVLAIEQLTGVAMAGQAALGGDANASAATALRTTQEMLSQATEDETKARNAKVAADNKVKATEKEISDLGDPGDDEEKKTKQQQLKAQLDADKLDAQKKGEALKTAQNSKQTIERNRDSAFAAANAAASGRAEVSDGKAGASSATQQHVANAVERIVGAVIGKNHLVDNCVNYLVNQPKDGKQLSAYLSDDAAAPSDDAAPSGDDVKSDDGDEIKEQNMGQICAQVVRADIKMRGRANEAQAAAYEGYFGAAPSAPKQGSPSKAKVQPRPKPEPPPAEKLAQPPSGIY